VAGASVKEIEWGAPEALQHRLAFDHGFLLQNALATLRTKVQQGALPLHLLPEKFTLTDVQRACEAVLGHCLDKGAFRRLIKDEPSLLPVPGAFLRGPQRPAQLFQASKDFEFQPRRNRS
jgi:hypothetical protein